MGWESVIGEVDHSNGVEKGLIQGMGKVIKGTKTSGWSPRRLTEEEEIIAWNSWASTAEKTPLERCIAVSQTLNTIALRHLWPTLSEWMKQENASEKDSVLA